MTMSILTVLKNEFWQFNGGILTVLVSFAMGIYRQLLLYENFTDE